MILQTTMPKEDYLQGLLGDLSQYQSTYQPYDYHISNAVYNPFKQEYMALSDNAIAYHMKNPQQYDFLNKLLNSGSSLFQMIGLKGLREPESFGFSNIASGYQALTNNTTKEKEKEDFRVGLINTMGMMNGR